LCALTQRKKWTKKEVLSRKYHIEFRF